MVPSALPQDAVELMSDSGLGTMYNNYCRRGIPRDRVRRAKPSRQNTGIYVPAPCWFCCSVYMYCQVLLPLFVV